MSSEGDNHGRGYSVFEGFALARIRCIIIPSCDAPRPPSNWILLVSLTRRLTPICHLLNSHYYYYWLVLNFGGKMKKKSFIMFHCPFVRHNF